MCFSLFQDCQFSSAKKYHITMEIQNKTVAYKVMPWHPLKNNGNQCFANAIVEAMNGTCSQLQSWTMPSINHVTCALKKVISKMCRKKVSKDNNLQESLGHISETHPHMSGSSQQDSAKFLHILLDSPPESVKKLFTGVSRIQPWKCTSCGQSCGKTEPSKQEFVTYTTMCNSLQMAI